MLGVSVSEKRMLVCVSVCGGVARLPMGMKTLARWMVLMVEVWRSRKGRNRKTREHVHFTFYARERQRGGEWADSEFEKRSDTEWAVILMCYSLCIPIYYTPFHSRLDTDSVAQRIHNYTRDIDSHWLPHLLFFKCPRVGRAYMNSGDPVERKMHNILCSGDLHVLCLIWIWKRNWLRRGPTFYFTTLHNTHSREKGESWWWCRAKGV